MGAPATPPVRYHSKIRRHWYPDSAFDHKRTPKVQHRLTEDFLPEIMSEGAQAAALATGALHLSVSHSKLF